MSKSILVIDTPKSCIDCPCCYADEVIVFCIKEKRRVFQNNNGSYPSWCPLKDMPEKKDMDSGKTIIRAAQHEGWNMCIDEVLKGVNGNE